jgi:hypothetical protein
MVGGNVIRRSQTVLNLELGILAVALLCCPVFGQTAVPEKPTPLTGNVPDESVTPQWHRILNEMLEASKSDFVGYRARPTPTQNTRLTDEELISGPPPQQPKNNPDEVVPQLEGAGRCKMVWITNIMDTYSCYFEPTGPNAEDMQKDFVKLVRLVEKATGTTATMFIKPEVSPASEKRSVSCGHVTVSAYWKLHPEPNNSSWPQPTDSFLSVGVSWTADISSLRKQSGQAPETSEIDTVLKSGNYTPLPPVQRISSSGYGPASIKVKNDTGYTLTLVYEGQSGTTVTVPATSPQQSVCQQVHIV